MKWSQLIILIVSTMMLSPSYAEEQASNYDRIHLSASATGRVDNDTMIATLFAQDEGPEAAVLANSVNQRIAWGVKLSEAKEGFKVQTQSYNTQPIYHKNNITGWRVRQSFRIETRNMAELSELLGVLQEMLGLEGVNFSVSPEQRNTAENALISEALEAFAQRAKIITQNLSRNNYKLVSMHVNTSGSAPAHRARNMRMEMMAADVAAPTMAAGDSQLTVNINGEIELD